MKRWTDEDRICALFLRHCGLRNCDIGAILGYSTKSVDRQIGCIPTLEEHAGFFDKARAAMARKLGQVADNFSTVGSA